MSYRYDDLKPWLYSEGGQRQFLEVRDKVGELLAAAGAFQLELAMVAGGTWESLACIDRLEELEEVRMVYDGNGFTQHRVYVRGSPRRPPQGRNPGGRVAMARDGRQHEFNDAQGGSFAVQEDEHGVLWFFEGDDGTRVDAMIGGRSLGPMTLEMLNLADRVDEELRGQAEINAAAGAAHDTTRAVIATQAARILDLEAALGEVLKALSDLGPRPSRKIVNAAAAADLVLRGEEPADVLKHDDARQLNDLNGKELARMVRLLLVLASLYSLTIGLALDWKGQCIRPPD